MKSQIERKAVEYFMVSGIPHDLQSYAVDKVKSYKTRLRSPEQRCADRLLAEYLGELWTRHDLGYFTHDDFVRRFESAYRDNGGVCLSWIGEVPANELGYFVSGVINKDVSAEYIAYISGKYVADGKPNPAYCFALICMENMRQVRNALSKELRWRGVGIWLKEA